MGLSPSRVAIEADRTSNKARTRHLLSWGLAAVAVHFVVSFILFDLTLGWQRGNYTLMVVADALRSGAGYRDIFLVDAPLHTATPPAYPSLLAFLGIFGGVVLYKLVSLAMTTVSVALTYRLGRRYLSGRSAGLAAVIVGVSPVFLSASHTVLPGAQLLLLTLLALWVAAETDRETDPAPASTSRSGSGGRRTWLGTVVIICAALAFLTHERAFPLLVAVPIWFFGRGQRRLAAVASGSAVAVAVLWAAFQLRGGPGSDSYLADLFFLGSELPGGGRVGPAEAAEAAARTAWGRASGVLGAFMGELPMMGTPSGRFLPGSLLVVGLALIGWTRAAGTAPGLAEIFALFYAFFAIVSQPEPSSAANLLPVISLVAIYSMAAACWLAESPVRQRGRPMRWPAVTAAVPLAVAVVFAVPALVEAVRIAPDRMACLRLFAAGAACEDESVTAFREVADWAGAETPDDAIVISRQPSMFYWFSGRRGAGFRRSSEPTLVMDGLDSAGADFLVIDHLDVTTTRYLAPVLRQSPARFRWVLSEGEPPTLLLGIEPPEAIVLAARAGR